MSKEELEQYFQSLEDIEALNDIFASIDENTLWQMYEKMNGTELGFLLEDIIYDDGNSEEQDSWDTIFGDYGNFFRKKRSTEERKGKGKMGDMDPEEMKTRISIGLSGFLMMEPEEVDLPRQLRDVPQCLKEILWESDEETRLCSILPKSLKSKIREIMLKVLKQDVSTNYFIVDWERLDRKIDKDDIDKLVQKVLSKISVPLNVTDISEIVNMAKNIWLKIVNQETDADKKKILNLVTGLFKAIDDNNVYSNIARIANKIQAAVLKKKDYRVLLEGDMGPAPDTDQLCSAYIFNRMLSSKSTVKADIVWTRKGQIVYRGQWEPLTGFWFWKRVATCGCSQQMCPFNFG